MKTGIKTILMCVPALVPVLLPATGIGGQFPGAGNDTNQSLATFTIVVNPAFQSYMVGYPGYSTNTKQLQSPLLSDSSTVIGRSAPLYSGSASDIKGVAVGLAGTMISNGSYNGVFPRGFLGPNNTREVHTQLYSLGLTGGGASVTAGTSAPAGTPISPGQVQSLSGASFNFNKDFPAKSFFDVFASVTLPAGGSFPGATFSNAVPLVIQNTDITNFPPTVIYIHGNSTAVPILFASNNGSIWSAGETFGVLTLAGHGMGYSTNTNSTATNGTTSFQSGMSVVPESPVDPQYSNWGPGLVVATNGFPNLGDDTVPSLGTFTIVVNPAYQSLFAAAAYPGYNTNTKRLTSPLLYDPSTVIGRSSPVTLGSSGASNGVTVGVSNPVTVSNASLSLLPPLFDSPAGAWTVFTKITTLNMAGGGASVLAGSASESLPLSPGQVTSLSGNSGNTNWDFPAMSFFDVFVDVTLPAAGSLPAMTLTNSQPLLVQQNSLTDFPPKVVYTHGNSSAVPVFFSSSSSYWSAGETMGILTLAGHGVGYTTNTTDETNFQAQMAQVQELPVLPTYYKWAPGLIVAPPIIITNILLQSATLTVQGMATTTNSTYYLLRTPVLGPQAVWTTNGTTTSDTNGNFSFSVPEPGTDQSYYSVGGPISVGTQ